MAAVIGLLPASGSASRLGGIPKFCLPLNDTQNILQWHVEQMLKVCDIVKISTRSSWLPIVNQMDLPPTAVVYEIEPSTMSDALVKMMVNPNSKYIIGMPDTYMPGSDGEFYKQLAESDANVTLAAFNCHEDLMGRVGQIKFDEFNNVIDALDKTAGCDYNYMWGAMSLQNVYVNEELPNPGVQIMDWANEGKDVKAVIAKGKYLDIGTVNGLKMLYREEIL
jgi:hypothetical protein